MVMTTLPTRGPKLQIAREISMPAEKSLEAECQVCRLAKSHFKHMESRFHVRDRVRQTRKQIG